MKLNEIEIWHSTEREVLQSILKEGLKPREDCTLTSVFMDKIGEQMDIKVKRCDSVYGFLPNKCPVERGPITVSIKVNPSKVYVADMEVATEVGMHYWGGLHVPNPDRRREHMEKAEMFAERYWDELVTLRDYKEKAKELAFMDPEIIIPEGVSPEKIEVAKKCLIE